MTAAVLFGTPELGQLFAFCHRNFVFTEVFKSMLPVSLLERRHTSYRVQHVVTLNTLEDIVPGKEQVGTNTTLDDALHEGCLWIYV